MKSNFGLKLALRASKLDRHSAHTVPMFSREREAQGSK